MCYNTFGDFMDLPNRKTNRLKKYDYTTPGYYFITICTKGRENILCDVVGEDAHIVPKPYGIIVEKYIKSIPGIDKYVIMPDHLHLIIKIENGPMWASAPTKSISQIVKSFKILVTKEIGRSIFQRSFFDHVIRNEEDYLETWNYIESNPGKLWEKYNGLEITDQ